MAKSIVNVLITGDVKGLQKAVGEADGLFKGFAKTAGIAIAGLGAAVAGTAYALKPLVDAASDLAETQSKVGVIFGDSAGNVEEFASTAARSIGQSRTQALDAAATFAIFGKSAGLAGDDLSDFATEFVTLASDLASFNNTEPEDAVMAIGAALRGESEPLRRYGVLLNDAALKSRAMEMGIYDGNGALTAQQKVLAAQAEILAQTGDAQGDFERTSDGLANQQRILSASIDDMKTKVGEAFLPAALEIVGALNDSVIPALLDTADKIGPALAEFVEKGIDAFKRFGRFASESVRTARDVVKDLIDRMKDLSEEFGLAQRATDLWSGSLDILSASVQTTNDWVREHKDLLLVIAGAIGGVITAYTLYQQTVGIYVAVTKVATAVAAAFNLVLYANPIMLAVLAIGALVAGLIVAYQKFEIVRDIIGTVGDFFMLYFIKPIMLAVEAIQKAWPVVVGAVEGIYDGIVSAFTPFAAWFDKHVISTFEAFVDFMAALVDRIASIMSPIVATVVDAFEIIVNAVDNAFAVIKSLFDAFVAIFTPVWDIFFGYLKATVGTAFDGIKAVIEITLGLIRGIFSFFAGLLRGDWSGMWDAIKSTAITGFSAIYGFISSTLTKLKNLWETIIGGIGDFASGVFGGLKDVFSAALNGVLGALETAINVAITLINGAIRAYNAIPLAPDIDTIDHINITPMATGGIVNKPTLALIGEAGPEAVVPLSGRNTPSLGGGNITINVAGSVIAEGDLIETVRRGLLDAQQSGKQVVYAA